MLLVLEPFESLKDMTNFGVLIIVAETTSNTLLRHFFQVFGWVEVTVKATA